MKYILGIALFFGTIWPVFANMLLKMQKDVVFELPSFAWHWIIPLCNFGIYFLLAFLLFKIMKLNTEQLKNKKLLVFNTGLIATSAIWFLGLIKVYISPLEMLLYKLPMKNLLLVAALLLFLGILQVLVEMKKEAQHVQ